MRITRLQLRNVKRHAELDLELAPGMTIIRGPNEAGKTTIQQAIEIGLFRRATTEARELDGVKRWGSEADPSVIIEIEDEGVEGRLAKTFAGQRGTVEMSSGQDVERDPAAVEQLISALTGLPSEKFFRATASVHHHDLSDLKQDEGTLRDRLQQSMTGATRGTHAAKRKLDDAIRRYRSEGHKNPGYLKVARDDVQRLQQLAASGEQALQQLEGERRALAEARSRRTALEAELARYQQGLARAERAVQLERQAIAAQQRYTTYKRAAELRAEISELEASHPSSIPLAGLRAAVERLRNLEFRLSELRAELAAEPEVRFDPLPEPRWRVTLLLAVAIALAGLGAIAGGVMLDQLIVGAAAGAVLLALALLLGSRAVRRRRQVADVQVQNQLLESEINRRLRGRSERADELVDTERERDEALAGLSIAELAEGERLLAAETDHVGRIDNLRAEYRGLLGDEAPSQDVAVIRDQAAAEADECRHALAGMGEIGAQPEKSLAAFKSTVERLRGEREQALGAERQAEGRLEANQVDAEQVAAQVEALGAATDRLEQVERRLRVYEQTLAAMQAAEQATMQKAARFLEREMGRDVARITDGRYRRLKVDEANLQFSVFSVERGEWVDADETLSRGTIDQLYLCARLGLVRQVTGDARPPLVFDDPFVTFDDDRARRALEMLRDAAAELQVIYLTCSDRYDALADKVIELPAPTGRDDAPEAGATGGTGLAGQAAPPPAAPGGKVRAPAA